MYEYLLFFKIETDWLGAVPFIVTVVNFLMAVELIVAADSWIATSYSICFKTKVRL